MEARQASLRLQDPLIRDNTISRQAVFDVESKEAQSRLKMKIAKDKLLVYGLSEAEIENAKNEDGVQKARMILRSRAHGVVVKRTVVTGNYYDPKDELMVIADVSLLRVTIGIDARDTDNIRVGQPVAVIFPFSVNERTVDAKVKAKVEGIHPEIEPRSGKVSFWTSIPNPDRRMMAGGAACR